MSEVFAVCKKDVHNLSKPEVEEITLLKGLGVEGDAHCGATVKHRSRVRKDPTTPNLRQVHLMHHELHQELISKGFEIDSGQMGENITTVNLDLLGLPTDTVLELGEKARIQVTGLRNPCYQLDNMMPGLMQAVLDKDDAGNLTRKAGVMAIVLESGVVKSGDKIKVVLPPEPHIKLVKV